MIYNSWFIYFASMNFHIDCNCSLKYASKCGLRERLLSLHPLSQKVYLNKYNKQFALANLASSFWFWTFKICLKIGGLAIIYLPFIVRVHTINMGWQWWQRRKSDSVHDLAGQVRGGSALLQHLARTRLVALLGTIQLGSV